MMTGAQTISDAQAVVAADGVVKFAGNSNQLDWSIRSRYLHHLLTLIGTGGLGAEVVADGDQKPLIKKGWSCNMVTAKRMVFVAAALLLLAIGTGIWLQRRPGCSIAYRFRPDITCRVLDVRDDGAYLLQSFDADTNELQLFLQQNQRDLQIEHPYGKVKSFNAVLERNEVRFNHDNYQTLVVNGEVFPITPSNPK